VTETLVEYDCRDQIATLTLVHKNQYIAEHADTPSSHYGIHVPSPTRSLKRGYGGVATDEEHVIDDVGKEVAVRIEQRWWDASDQVIGRKDLQPPCAQGCWRDRSRCSVGSTAKIGRR